MSDQPPAETLDLVNTVANYDPAFFPVLRRALETWTSCNVKGPASLVWMEPFCRKGHSNSLKVLLLMLPPAKLKTLAKKFDRHNAALSNLAPEQMASHIVQLASGEIEPAAKPAKSTKPTKAKTNGAAKMKFADILSLSDSERRQKELSRLTVGELRTGMKEAGMDALPKTAKPKLIQNIEAELVAGWPHPRSVLDTSRY